MRRRLERRRWSETIGVCRHDSIRLARPQIGFVLQRRAGAAASLIRMRSLALLCPIMHQMHLQRYFTRSNGYAACGLSAISDDDGDRWCFRRLSSLCAFLEDKGKQRPRR